MKIIKTVSLVLLINCISTPAYASFWQNLWSRPDQQAAELLQKGKTQKASQTFRDPHWQAVSQYRGAQYEKALEQFSQFKTDKGFYNSGNALAHLGQYQEAIDVYDKALTINSHNADAQYNRDLLKKLLENQEKQPQSKTSQDKNKQKDKSKKESKQDQANKDKDKKEKDSKKKDQQDQQKKDQEQEQEKQQAKNKQDKQQDDKKDKPSKEQQAKKDKEGKEKPQPSQQQQKQLTEKQRSDQQWLKRVPDDPGGLLRQKFLRDHLRRQR